MAQMLAQKCGISGTGPTTVIGQTGELKRVIGWIGESWLNIQQVRQDWEWMRGSVAFQTVPGQATYTAADAGITDFAEWVMNSKACTFRNYLASVGVGSEIFLSYMPYETWRDTYQYGAMRLTKSRPVAITITPDQSIGLGLTPDTAGYTVVGDYFKTPSEMTVDTDVPGLPARYHMLIVYQAMVYYAMYEEDEYLRQMAETQYRRMMASMTIAQLPEVRFGGGLA